MIEWQPWPGWQPWAGPFSEVVIVPDDVVFTVEYEHDLVERPEEFVFFYALGTAKDFPVIWGGGGQEITTAQFETTTAEFDISLPPGFNVTGVYLDHTPVDPWRYQIAESQLTASLTSQFGPFTQDLVITLVPEPATLCLLGLGGLALLRRRAS